MDNLKIKEGAIYASPNKDFVCFYAVTQVIQHKLVKLQRIKANKINGVDGFCYVPTNILVRTPFIRILNIDNTLNIEGEIYTIWDETHKPLKTLANDSRHTKAVVTNVKRNNENLAKLFDLDFELFRLHTHSSELEVLAQNNGDSYNAIQLREGREFIFLEMDTINWQLNILYERLSKLIENHKVAIGKIKEEMEGSIQAPQQLKA